ncbi:GrpB family protein [Arthrobacter sp. JSM 101049]|uniref:GrpB family protein n=1 Tax=Arthrobacter sp. JSM 101049 TaxID=929097 RepID=UPI00356686C0
MAVEVVPHSPEWPRQLNRLAAQVRECLNGLPAAVEHVDSTAVPGLAAKPVLDMHVIVDRRLLGGPSNSLELAGYRHRGDLGPLDRETFLAPNDRSRRNVYVCVAGTLHVRNHLAARDVLRIHPGLRERFSAVKLALAEEPEMGIDRYTAGKSAILQEFLAASDLTAAESCRILELDSGT